MDAFAKQMHILKAEPGAAKPARVVTAEEAEQAVHTLLLWIGEDPEREGLRDTPKRVAKAWKEMFAGYDQSPEAQLSRTFEEVSGYDDVVLVRDIPFFSHCEHHIVPIVGTAHVAYYPVDRVVGLSKIARVVDIFAKRLQTQEKMTAQVTQTIDDTLKPRGIAVMIEGQHMCMSMRGVQKLGTSTITSQFTGIFRDDPAEQARFMSLVRHGRP